MYKFDVEKVLLYFKYFNIFINFLYEEIDLGIYFLCKINLEFEISYKLFY